MRGRMNHTAGWNHNNRAQQLFNEGDRPVSPPHVQKLVARNAFLLIGGKITKRTRQKNRGPQPAVGQRSGQPVADEKRHLEPEPFLELGQWCRCGCERPGPAGDTC